MKYLAGEKVYPNEWQKSDFKIFDSRESHLLDKNVTSMLIKDYSCLVNW